MKTTLKNQLEAFDRGVFLDSDGKESWCYNFYDWFCKDKSLERKSIALFKKVKKFMSNYPELDQEKLYVFFKNNCPMVGSLYDDFRICDIETGNVVFTVVPKCSHSGKAEIWGKANDWKGAIKVADNFTGLFK
jgi:hypothetical protein